MTTIASNASASAKAVAKRLGRYDAVEAGTVMRFKVKYAGYEREFVYAAISTGDGRWFTTSRFSDVRSDGIRSITKIMTEEELFLAMRTVGAYDVEVAEDWTAVG